MASPARDHRPALVRCRRAQHPRRPSGPRAGRPSSFRRRAVGLFTATESAAFGATCALPVTILMYRALTWERPPVRTSAVVFLLVGTATAFAYLLALDQLPGHLTDAMLAISSNRSR